MGIWLAFVILPALSAVCVAALSLEPRSLLALSGACWSALMLALVLGPPAPLLIALPVLTGGGLGGLIGAGLKWLHPDGSPWTRMSLALVATTGFGLFLFALNSGGR